MRLGELASVQRWLPTHPTAADPFWQREALVVTETDIQLFYARNGLKQRRQAAIEAIDALQAAVISAAFDGQLKEPPAAVVLHELPTDPFLVDELVDGLVKLRPARRQACLFALETGSNPKAATELSWPVAQQLQQLSPLCREILEAAGRTRHIKLPYVFWEWATTRIAAPLLDLEWSIGIAFGRSWPQLQQCYRNMVKLNRDAEAASLLELANHPH